MSDLKLVPPEQPTSFEQQLLDAVANEAPSAEQRARVRLALGLAAVAPPPASASVAPAGRRALLLKAGIGLVGVTGLVCVLFFTLGRKTNHTEAVKAPIVATPSPEVAAVPSVISAGSDGVAADSAAATTPASRPIESAPSAASLARDKRDDGAPTKRTNKPLPADSAADLSEQLRLIDSARAAVAAGNAATAAAALASYRTRFPRGPFAQEAAVLQIETLDLQGNHALAAAQARSFLAHYPNSPHATVVRRIAER